MLQLAIEVRGASAAPETVTPALGLRLGIATRPGVSVHALTLRCQVQLEVQRRTYSPEEQESLADLFGTPERWGETLRPILWLQASLVVPAFESETETTLYLDCSYDLAFGPARLFHALKGGEVPLVLMFSGSIFHRGPGGELHVVPVPWSTEARFRLPVAAWKQCVERFYPGTAGLKLRREVADRLVAFKTAQGLATFDQALERLLDGARGAS